MTEEVDDLGGEYCYSFKVLWDNWDEAERQGCCGVQGLDMSLRKEEYIRSNVMPSFMYVRTIPINREDWQSEYKRFGVPIEVGQDQWEFMVCAGGRCMEDPCTVKRIEV